MWVIKFLPGRSPSLTNTHTRTHRECAHVLCIPYPARAGLWDRSRLSVCFVLHHLISHSHTLSPSFTHFSRSHSHSHTPTSFPPYVSLAPSLCTTTLSLYLIFLFFWYFWILVFFSFVSSHTSQTPTHKDTPTHLPTHPLTPTHPHSHPHTRYLQAGILGFYPK